MDNVQIELYTDNDNIRILRIQIISSENKNNEIVEINKHINQNKAYLKDKFIDLYNRIINNNTERIILSISSDFGYVCILKIVIELDNSIKTYYIHYSESDYTIEYSEELSNEIVNKLLVLSDILINNKERFYSNEYIKI